MWGSKPLLSYFVLTASLSADMQEQIHLSPQQWQAVTAIAELEAYQLKKLLEASDPIVSNPDRPLWLKRIGILWTGYNRQVDLIVARTDLSLRELLGYPQYSNLVKWINKRWQIEQLIHGNPISNILPSARSFQIYATRYDSGGAYYVALPDKCVKFTNGGNSICSDEGYIVGQKYTVYISYTNSAGVVVGESGPWNVDDNYWSGWNDPTPRRMFADLPVGMPEAQAAYFNGYNGGVDQFGRKVTGPFGIDLARQVSIDIGLQPGKNDWITVSFLWTEGWDNPGASNTPVPGSTGVSAATAVAIVPIQVASPMPDGSVVHKVEYGQSLWAIAIAYQTTIQSINRLNNLTESSVIWPGDELVVLPPGSMTPQPSLTVDSKPTLLPTDLATPLLSPVPTSTPGQEMTAIVEQMITEISAASNSPEEIRSGFQGFLILGAVLAGLGIVLLITGWGISRKKSSDN